MASLPYFERQVGGNCRIHSLNALFGEKYVTPALLAEFSAEFDAGYESGLTMQFDGVQSDTLMLVSYVVERGGRYRCLHVAPGGIGGLLRETGKGTIEELVDDVPAIMMFTPGHIWTVRREGERWWNLDSMGGRPRDVTGRLNQFQRNKKLGFLFIYQNPDRVLRPLLERRLRRAMGGIRTEEALVSWLTDAVELGDAEPALFALLRLGGGGGGGRCLREYSQTMSSAESRVTNYVPLFMSFIGVWGG